MQLFGFRKTPDLSLAPLQASAVETCGLRSGDGRLLVAAARSHILANPPYTRDLLSTISGLSWREGLSARHGACPERSRGGPRSRRREVAIGDSPAGRGTAQRPPRGFAVARYARWLYCDRELS